MSPARSITSPPHLDVTTSLFVQAECSRVMAATSLVREHHVGVVYTVDASRRNMRYQDPLEAIAYTRERAPDAEILMIATCIRVGTVRSPPVSRVG